MSKKRAVGLMLQAVIVVWSVWYSSLMPEVREIMLGMLFRM